MYPPGHCSEHTSGERSTCCESVRMSVCVPCDYALFGHVPMPVCVCVYLLEELCRLWGHRWMISEDDHQKCDRTSSCRRTTSERAPWEGARNNSPFGKSDGKTSTYSSETFQISSSRSSLLILCIFERTTHPRPSPQLFHPLERSFYKAGHRVRARWARLSKEHVKELSLLPWH